MAPTLEPRASGAGTVSFELERLEPTAAGRLELSGRWFGVRGRRFVRPTLTFEADGQPYRLLADLEHKPWSAEEGMPWTAVFAWGADTGALGDIELTVAPDIVIPLSGGDGRGGSFSRGRRVRSDNPAATLARELQAARQELADERRTSERLRGELEPLREEFEAVRAELDRIREEKIDADATLARRDAALARLTAVEAQRDDVRRSLEEAETERDELRRAHRQVQVERDRALAAADRLRAEGEIANQARDKALTERDHALRARDQALTERNHALGERDQLARAGDSLESQRAAARALVTRRNLAWRASPWTAPGRRAGGASADIRRREIGWPARILALVLLVAAVVVLAALLHVI
jgi:hypothetical protein